MSEPNESWAREHARKNPGHRTTEGRQHEGGKSEAGMCETCGAKVELPDFLLARIAEDEASCGEGQDQFGWHRWDDCVMAQSEGYGDCTCGYPARVLAECEAKRRIVALADLATEYDESLQQEFGVGSRDMKSHPYLGDDILHALALPYADHPDYRPEWRL